MGVLLDKIDSPEALKNMSVPELKDLCAELREYMVDVCSRYPGHLASSLGAVEIITALHYIYNTPNDKIVFDVGHQAYAHKILTGRKKEFSILRTAEGTSGFPSRDESPYDAFGTGHSSTSISAALGFAEAARMQGSGHKVVAVIGDGALTGGLAFEGLNNSGDGNADLLIILNDNNQSIDKNTGSIHNHLMSLTTNPAYNRFKDKIWERLGETRARGFFQRWIRSLKSWVVKSSGGDLFEALGFRYFGPIDGNDIEEMVKALGKLKNIKGPRILHCLTVKGKGYAPAEDDPVTWHAPGRFNPATGERKPAVYAADRYQDVFGQVLLELARMDSRVVGITPAMASGCGMNVLAREMPERFFDVGIEEEHAVTFSAGLAAGGMKPFCNIYSAFSQRAYDQIIHDIALQRLPVVICLDRAGLVGEDGATHHGAFDLAAYRSIPGAVIAVPADETELKMAMFTGLRAQEGPYIIRYPRGKGEGSDWRSAPYEELPVGRGKCLRNGEKVAILALGPVAHRAVAAADKSAMDGNASPAVYDMRYLKPVDAGILEEAATRFDTLITLEDGVMKGGLFSEVSEYVASKGLPVKVKAAGIPDRFIPHGRQTEQWHECGLDVESIVSMLETI